MVAALTSWRDRSVLSFFQEAELELYITKESPTEYLTAKESLVQSLHDWFLYKDEQGFGADAPPPQSPFSTGDVDIFIQASPFTRAPLNKLGELGLDANLRNHVCDFLERGGGST